MSTPKCALSFVKDSPSKPLRCAWTKARKSPRRLMRRESKNYSFVVTTLGIQNARKTHIFSSALRVDRVVRSAGYTKSQT